MASHVHVTNLGKPSFNQISNQEAHRKYMGSVVLLRAILKGMGHEVECDVIARRMAPDTREKVSPASKYSNCSVLAASTDLPDGEYTVHTDSGAFTAFRRSGRWL
jgi:hypothetical protein